MAITSVPDNVDSTSYANLLKRLQPQKKIDALWQQMYPGFGLIRKVDDFEGSQIDCPLEYDHPFVSRTFSSAQSYRHPSSQEQFNLTRKKLYGIGRIDMEQARSSRSDKGAWVRSVAHAQKNTLLAMRKRMAIQFYRGTGGALGQITSTGIANGDGTNDRLTLTNKSDVYNFSVGMAINGDTVDGGGTVHAGRVYVGKIDFTNGYLYVVDNAGSATDYTVDVTSGGTSDYLFADGDYDNSIHGLESWIPLTAPSSGEDFLGMDRSVAPERLAGHRLNDTSLTREEMVQELAARIAYTGGADLRALMSPAQMKQFALELDTKVVRDPGGKGRVGFSGILVDTAAGQVECLADPACPEDRMFLIDPSSFVYHHLDPVVHLVMDDGLRAARRDDADEIEFRYRGWGNLACSAPGKNAVSALPTVL